MIDLTTDQNAEIDMLMKRYRRAELISWENITFKYEGCDWIVQNVAQLE